jgi:bifunctional DNA-binding transcriptional regulator/antitoxin component of YhaV-PrlF toxin-antitoxin module
MLETTRLSSKGQIIIPQRIREAHKWLAGLEFNVFDTEQGLLFIPRLPFKPTSIKDVRGCVHYKGKKKSLKEMDEGIAKGAKESK